MSAPSAKPVSHVSDTARWVAMYRAMETDRPDALFRDPWARKLAGPEGEAILRGIPKGAKTSWPIVVRTQVMDELIQRVVRQQGADTVLNLASGLDARPYRLSFPSPLRWLDVDFADVLSYKRSVLDGQKPQCAVEYTPLDLSDDAARASLFARAGASSNRTLVVTEGLLVYLEREHVARLASDLSAQSSFHWWLMDLASPDLLKRLNKTWGKALEKSPLIFGPPEGTQFFSPYGWRQVEYRSVFEESLRLNRTMPMARVLKFLGRFYPEKTRERFRRMSGIVLLERK